MMSFRRTFVAAWIAALAILWTAPGAFAQPGPNGNNDYGLCKAYFAGSPTGRANKRQAPPFVALEAVACGACDGGCECDPSNNDPNGTPEDPGDDEVCNDSRDRCVADFCPDTNPGGKGKNPSDGPPGQSRRQG